MSGTKFMVFDIETGALSRERIEEIAPEFKPESVKVGNLGLEKTQSKINAARVNHLERIVDKAALHAEYGRILAIGTCRSATDADVADELQAGSLESDVVIWIQEPRAKTDDSKIIKEFWAAAEEAAAAGYQLVGHNIFKFDLPFLVRRSYALGIKPPTFLMPSRGRYWGYPWLDTMAAWSLGDYQEMISLDRLSKHLGFVGKNGSGKYFAQMLEEDFESAYEYLAHDITLTYQVTEKILPLLAGTEIGQ